MATIKSYTDLEQSKKLVEILPLESSDMVYLRCDFENEDEYSILVGSYHEGYAEREDGTIVPVFDEHIPAWSFAALLSVLPKGTNISISDTLDKVRYSCWNDYDITYASNPIDACVAMIEKLHELNLL